MDVLFNVQAAVEPRERRDQKNINNLTYMRDACDEICTYLKDEEYDKYFHDEIVDFVAAIRVRVQERIGR